MAGKPKNTAWGGARSGAGRKPKYMLTDNQVKHMLKKARKLAKETGRDIDDILLGIIYGVERGHEVIIIKGRGNAKKKIKVIVSATEVKDALAAIRLFKDYTMSKTSEQNINVTKQSGPAIGLPPMREDPALKVVGGKDRDNANRKTG